MKAQVGLGKVSLNLIGHTLEQSVSSSSIHQLGQCLWQRVFSPSSIRCLHDSHYLQGSSAQKSANNNNEGINSVGGNSHNLTTSKSSRLLLGRHVREALVNGSPIVALESTVITHGLPEPQNFELAMKLESEIAEGHWWWQQDVDYNSSMMNESTDSSLMKGKVVPATIGIIKGQIVIGMSRDEIQYLANHELSRPLKASRRDIPIALGRGLSAGTTVSATMAIATSLRRNSNRLTPSNSAINVFATGGMGGVHLGGENSMDISADLYEFARSPIGVVSSGFKSFLDTRRSLEFLETMGATVTSLAPTDSTYQARFAVHNRELEQDKFLTSCCDHQHQTDHLFPGFFDTINKEQVKSPWRCENVQEAAGILFNCLDISHDNHIFATQNNRRAMLIACPIPSKFSLNLKEDSNYKHAMDEISSIDSRTDLSGKEKTPMILEQLNRLTGGKTLRANIELLRNNARIGAHLAYEYAQIANRHNCGTTTLASESTSVKVARDKSETDPSIEEANELVHQDKISPETKNCKLDTGGSRRLDRTDCGPLPANGPVVVIGCTMIDLHVSTKMDEQFKSNPSYSGVTFEGKPHLTLGGVGRNLATALQYLGHEPIFVTSLGSDNLADFALNELETIGLGGGQNSKLNICRNKQAQDHCDDEHDEVSTCFALVLMDSISGQCEYVIANLAANQAITRSNMSQNCIQSIERAQLVVLDANLPKQTVGFLLEQCSAFKVPIFLEPTDVVCLARLVSCLVELPHPAKRSLAYLSPNVIELIEILKQFETRNSFRSGNQTAVHSIQLPTIDNSGRVDLEKVSLDHVSEMARLLMDKYLPNLKCLLVTMDKRGLLVAIRQEPESNSSGIGNHLTGSEHQLQLKHFATLTPIERPVSASGAGDSFASGFISGLLRNYELDKCVELGFQAAELSLQDRDTISKRLSELQLMKN